MDLSNLSTIRIAACDLNGQMRGKRLPAAAAAKLGNGGARMPLSALNLDLWGSDIDNSPLVFESGDADGVLLPTNRGAVPMPWGASSYPGTATPFLATSTPPIRMANLSRSALAPDLPTAITIRPQLASSPAIAVFTNGELATDKAICFASA